MKSSSFSLSDLSPARTLGDLVVAEPRLARIFEQLQLDYCCGGRQTLAAACAQRGLAVADIVARLAGEPTAAASVEPDVSALSLAELADHIERTHHAYVKAELPRLVELAARVARRHGEKDARLAEVSRLTVELAEEMLCHMQKEEFILFPLVRQIDATRSRPVSQLLAGPIAQMEAEHRAAGDATSRLSLLTGGFVPEGAFCAKHQALLAGLARFQEDLHRHVHKENNVLFPRALERAVASTARSA